MSFNYFEAANGLFPTELISKAGTFLNENETNVSKAIQCIIPSIIKGISSRSGSIEGANTIALMAYEQYNNPIAPDINDFFGEKAGSFLNPGSKLLHKLFGDKTDVISEQVSSYSGIGHSSSMTLLSIATPTILGLLGKYAASSQLDATKLADLLSQQKDIAVKAMPSGYTLNGLFNNWDNAGKIAVPVLQPYSAPAHTADVNEAAEKAVGYLKWLIPLLILMLIAIFFFLKNK